MLTVHNLRKSYGSAGPRRRPDDPERVFAVGGASFEVHDGELFTLLGPSGCGKTTTLRSIAGLERPDDGRITLTDRVLFDAARRVNVPASQRQLGMVFQSYAIWPHMNVFKNVSFRWRCSLGRVGPVGSRSPSGWSGCWRSPSSPTTPTARPPSSLAASSSGSRWPAR